MTVFTLFLFSIVVWINRGLYDPSILALTLLFLAWVMSVILNWKKGYFCEKYLKWIPWIWAALFLIKSDVLYIPAEFVRERWLLRVLPLSGMLVFSILKNRLKWIGVAILLLPFFLTLLFSPSPHIDVFQSNRMAVDFLMHGLNPYSQNYPDIYGNTFDYKPGFLYLPGALFFQTISQILFHDIRTLLVLAWIATGLFFTDSKRWMPFFLTVPFMAFALEQAWLDPLITFGGALVLFGLRKNRMVFLVLGAVIAASVKQYGFMIGLFSLFYFYHEQGFGKAVKPAVLIGVGVVAIVAPFVFWNPNDFLNSTVLNHAGAEIRPDALNFTAFWLKQTGERLPALVQLLAIGTGLILGLTHVSINRLKRGLKVIPESWAIFFGFSILFGKFAFCNYYSLMISFWLFAEILDVSKSPTSQESLPPNNEARRDRRSHSV